MPVKRNFTGLFTGRSFSLSQAAAAHRSGLVPPTAPEEEKPFARLAGSQKRSFPVKLDAIPKAELFFLSFSF